MSKFIIMGGRKLSGDITVAGSKNAALPIIFSTLITRGVSILYGVPDISDVNVALQILRDMGAGILRDGEALYIDTGCVTYRTPDDGLVSKIRASSYLLGATLSRFGKTELQHFGGCNFDKRPVDMHIAAMRAVGAVSFGTEFLAPRLNGADITFDKISVGATINALLLTASANGTSRIFGYAREPHVYSLIEFLNTAGAEIKILPEYLLVEGRELHGGVARIIPDMIEAGTYVAASLATDSSVRVCGINRDHLSSLTELLTASGAGFVFGDGCVEPFGSLDCFVNVHTAPYPGFPTDLQPQTAPLLAAFRGGRITEGVWRGRFGYLSELEKFGVGYSLTEGGAVILPSKLKPATAVATDLRGGAALVIAALVADGESVIESAEIIRRGYENITEKLRGVGAEIIEIF